LITRIVKLQFQAAKAADFLLIFNDTKLMVSNFEGCSGMQLLQDIKDPSVFFTYSQWESEDALLNYRQSDLFKTLWKSIKPLFEIPAEAWSTAVYFDGFESKKK
jgi:heme-degrading monooxygenase HmoA